MVTSRELESNSDGEKKPATHASFSAKEEFADQAKAFRTPLKRKYEVLDEVGFLSFTPHKKQVLDPASLVGLTEAQILSQVLSFFNAVDTSLSDTAEIVMRFLNAYESSCKDFSYGLKSLELRVTDITDEAGSPPEGLSEEYVSPSIWGTISSLASKLGELEALKIGGDELTNSFKAVEERLITRFTNDTKTQAASQAKLASDVAILRSSSISANHLGSEINSLKSTVVSLGSLLRNRIGAEAFRIDTLEQAVGHVSSPVAAPVTNASSSILQSTDQFYERVDRLETEMTKLTARNDEQAVKFASLGFRKIDEVAAWLTINCPENAFGLVVDPHMVFEHMNYNLHSEDSLDRLQKLYKLKIETIGQGISIKSFENKVPKLLSSGTTSVVRDDVSHFDKIPTHADWKLNEEGWYSKFKAEVHEFQVAHSKTLREELDPESKMYSIAVLALSESVAWVLGFLAFIQEYYEDLTNGKFGSKKGWHVTTRLAKRLIEEVHVPRSSVIKAIRAGNSAHISKQLFWASLQSIDIASRIKNNNYKNDPLVSSELVKFLAINTGFESIEKLQREVSELKEKVFTSSKAASVAEKGANAAGNKADENKKVIDSLVKRITKLESKG
jgi:hypothetical protein